MEHSIHDSATDWLQTRISAPSPALRDVQPILERRPTASGPWVEQARDGICDALRQACENEGFDALVVKSPKEGNEFTRVNTVESGWQQLTEYDVTDVNCLTEWTHTKLVQLVKRLMEERKIDQEIDFKFLRGERQNLTTSEQTGEGVQQVARRVTRKLVRMG